MKMKFLTALLAGFTLVIISLQSCTKQGAEPGSDSANTSGTSENESGGGSSASGRSHNMGLNCMNCHYAGGPGEGVFTVAGTVYDTSKTVTFPGATVKLFTGPNGTGTLKYTLTADGSGNFHTTQSIDFTTALYPAVQGKSNTFYMSMSITMGQCNGCHGVTTNRIFAQ
ncbi:MAG TPA: hypothetical protein VHP12_07385 [Chitinophagaceae bacterium]|nr:hypothetical protein [Chitinophagaceae bacterium]